MTQCFFCPCPRGLEVVLQEELARLDATAIRTVDGGAHFEGPFELGWKVNLESRIASRVLWQVAHAPYRSERDLYDLIRGLPWDTWFSVERSIRVDVTGIRARVKSLDFVTLRVKDAVCDAFRDATGSRPDVDTKTPDARIHAFLTASHATVYVDTTGEPLFKRGYRRVTGEAPLRENLAAGILRLTRWDGRTALLDPMCGSGTFLCEAAMIALDKAPGLERDFSFRKLRNHDDAAWAELKAAARTRVRTAAALPIFGSDRYGEALKLARANLAALGVERLVTLKQADVLEMPPPASSGIIVTNPPYGVRLEDQHALAELYPRLGDALKKKYAAWTAYIFTADLRLPKLIGLAASRRTPLYNGALECRLFEFKLVAGSMRRKPVNRESDS
ncbi:MAG: THUMP domain-containing class I SAM-dependent RNA methyltransferase [Burkholderiales bacterium]